MSIVLQEPGMAGIAAGAGKIIGEAEAAKQIHERALRRAELEADRQYEADRAQINLSVQLEGERRARMWELEKMEIASRNDFARAEQKRAMELDERDSKVKAIKQAFDNGQIDQKKADALTFSVMYEIPFSDLYETGSKEKIGSMPFGQQYLTEKEREEYNRQKLLNPPPKIGTTPFWATPAMVGTPIFKGELEKEGVYWDSLTDEEKELQLKALGISTEKKPETIKETVTKMKKGDVISKGGKKWKIVAFDTDGEPLVEEVK